MIDLEFVSDEWEKTDDPLGLLMDPHMHKVCLKCTKEKFGKSHIIWETGALIPTVCGVPAMRRGFTNLLKIFPEWDQVSSSEHKCPTCNEYKPYCLKHTPESKKMAHVDWPKNYATFALTHDVPHSGDFAPKPGDLVGTADGKVVKAPENAQDGDWKPLGYVMGLDPTGDVSASQIAISGIVQSNHTSPIAQDVYFKGMKNTLNDVPAHTSPNVPEGKVYFWHEPESDPISDVQKALKAFKNGVTVNTAKHETTAEALKKYYGVYVVEEPDEPCT